MSIIFHCNWPNKTKWIHTLKKKFNREKIYKWPNIYNKEKIKYAIVWNFPKGELKKFKNLKIIFSMGAGVDHLFKDPNLPKIPIVRIKDPIMQKRMLNYVQSQILNYQIKNYDFFENQKKFIWDEKYDVLDNDNLNIGILGSGYLGNFIGKGLIKNGYKVQGFKKSRVLKHNINYKIYSEKKHLNKFITTSDVIVNVLPNTLSTKNFININFLKKMKKNSLLINVGRGTTVNENDLINFAKKNKGFFAVLDVFEKEPLAKDHKFWKLKNVMVTPHIASITNISSAVDQIYKIYHHFKKTKKLKNLVNWNNQY
tara:strand:- start:168 stop:1103 length:936 start_codon:yes stop_codon:yes gene_type:complete